MAVALKSFTPVKDTNVRTRSLVRDDFQLQIDKDVAALKERWEKAGKPEPGPKAPFHAYGVEKDDRVEIKRNVRRAAGLAKVDAIFHTDAETPEGLWQVKFNLKPQTEKESGHNNSGPA
jgi:hypothetical protein